MDEDQVGGIWEKKWTIRTCVDYVKMYFNFPFYIRYLGFIFKNHTSSSQRTVIFCY